MQKIIDAHVHISIFNKNARSLQESFDLLKKEMEKNDVTHAIVIPDNIEGNDQIADLETANALVGSDHRFSLLGSPQIIQRGTSELKKYEQLLMEKKSSGLNFFLGTIHIIRRMRDVCRITNCAKDWTCRYFFTREKTPGIAHVLSGTIHSIS